MIRKWTNKELLDDLYGQTERVLGKMGVPDDIVEDLKLPQKILVRYLPVEYNGKIVNIPVIRVIHTSPSGGGWRITIVSSIEEAIAEATMLATLMSVKLSTAGELLGGAKAVMVIDPKATRELKDLACIKFGEVYAPEMVRFEERGKVRRIDRIAGDQNTGSREMAMFLKGARNVLGGKVPIGQIMGLATGKELDGTPLGGLPGRSESTGYVVIEAARLLLEEYIKPKGEITIVIDGFGKVSIAAAERAVKLRWKVIGVSDSKGGILNYSGLDVEAVKTFKKETGTVVGFPGAEVVSLDAFLKIKCTVLAPCATEGRITDENANEINALVIAEGANMGATSKAKDIISERGIPFFDGNGASQGGVVASNREADQNEGEVVYSFEETIKYLDRKVGASFREVLATMKKYNMNMPDAILAYGMWGVIKLRYGKTLDEILAERAEK